MQLNRDGQVSVEIVPAPLPAKWFDERPRVIVGQRGGAMLGVSDLLQGGLRTSDVPGQAEEVEIALIAFSRIDTEIGLMRKALEKHELDSVSG